MGTSWLAGDTVNHATLWNGTTVIDLGGSREVYRSTEAINSAGQVVGAFDNHAALWNCLTVTDLNIFRGAATVSAGWYLDTAYGINDRGWIVGTAWNGQTGYSRGFLLTPAPVPEPETYALMLAGLGLLAVAARRRKAD